MSVKAAALTEETPLLDEFKSAVSDDLMMLCVLHNAEPERELIKALRDADFPRGLGLRLTSETARGGVDLLSKALTALPEPVDEQILDELAADYANIYLTHGLQASPCESVWFDDEGLTHQQPMTQVRAQYRQHGLMAADWRKREDDHLVLQLQFLAHLLNTSQASSGIGEAARFMDEHLLRWLGKFSWRVAQRCATDYFAGVVLLSWGYCEELRDIMAEILREPRPRTEEIEVRMKPKREHRLEPVKFMPGVEPSW